MIKLIQLFVLLSFLLGATTTVFASFCTHGSSSGPSVKIDRFGVGSSKRWLPSGPLHLKRANIPGDISDGFPSSQQQSLDSFALSRPEVPSVNSGGLDLSDWKNYGLKDYIAQASKVDLVQNFEKTRSSASESLAEARQLLLDKTNNMPGYGQNGVGGVGVGVDDLKAALVTSAAANREALKLSAESTLDTMGAGVNDLRAALVSSAAASRDALKVSSAETYDALKESTAANLEVVKASTAATLETSREGMLSAKREMIDKAVEIYSSETFQTQQTKFIDVGQRFSTVLETKYHLPELSGSIMRGEPLKNFMDYVSDRCHAFVDAMDLKNNAPFLALLVTIFWASNARRDGIQYGKLQAQGTIESLQDKLESTKAAAKTETDLTTTDLKDLRKQLNVLKSQVEILTVAAQDAAEQLNQEKGGETAWEVAHTPPQVIVDKATNDVSAAAQDVAEQLSQEKAGSGAGEVAHTTPQEVVEKVTNDVGAAGEVAHTLPWEIVEKVTNDVGAATASSPVPEHNVKAEEAFKVAAKVADRAPKKATPKKKPSTTVETIAPQMTDIATVSSDADAATEPEALSSDADIIIEPGEVEVGEAFVPTAEVEVAQPQEVTPKKSAPKKKATKANAKVVEGSMSEISALSSDSTVTMEPEETAVDVTPNEAESVQSTLSGTKAKDASGTDGTKKLKEAAKKTSTMKKKTIVVTGATRTKKSPVSEAPPETVEETKKRAPTNVSVGPDWGNLSESTLKRKTLKELLDYLEMKGVEVADTEGKKLNKDTLVNLVISR